jgi:steroid 5-alpha reductase family enzyme
LPAVLFLVGILLVGVGAVGRAWCSLYIAGYKTSTLVTEGPYSISRNPLYLFSLIGLVGVGLCSETLLIPAILAMGFALYYPAVIRQEEKKLLRLHAEAFQEYMATTPRFLPKLSNLREPAQYVVNPRVFRKHIFESMLFVWVVGMLELVETLHKLHVLPTVLKIY